MIKEKILEWIEQVVGNYIGYYESLEFDENYIEEYLNEQTKYSAKIMTLMKVHDDICEIEENPEVENDDERVGDEMLLIVKKEIDIRHATSKSKDAVKYLRENIGSIFALNKLESKILSFKTNGDQLETKTN